MSTTQMGAEDLELLESSAASTRERLRPTELTWDGSDSKVIDLLRENHSEARDIDLQQKFDAVIEAQNRRANMPMHDYLVDMNTKIHKLEASMSETLPDALKGYLL